MFRFREKDPRVKLAAILRERKELNRREEQLRIELLKDPQQLGIADLQVLARGAKVEDKDPLLQVIGQSYNASYLKFYSKEREVYGQSFSFINFSSSAFDIGLKETSFSHCDFTNASFLNYLDNVTFNNCWLGSCTFKGPLLRVKFKGCTDTEKILVKGNDKGTIFTGLSPLPGADERLLEIAKRVVKDPSLLDGGFISACFKTCDKSFKEYLEDRYDKHVAASMLIGCQHSWLFYQPKKEVLEFFKRLVRVFE